MPIEIKPYTIDTLDSVSLHHVACVLLLDTSGSMTHTSSDGKRPIDELNAGIRAFKEETLNNTSLSSEERSAIDVAIVSFGGDEPRVNVDFAPISEITIPTLDANGMTPMGKALDVAMDMIEARKTLYKEIGTPYYRPWIFCITDGEPTDEWRQTAQRLRDMEDRHKLLAYCVGVTGFNIGLMTKIFDEKRIIQLKGLEFTTFFKFLSQCFNS